MKDSEDYLKKNYIPDRTIIGRKPSGQLPGYRSSLSELMEEFNTYTKNKYIIHLESKCKELEEENKNLKASYYQLLKDINSGQVYKY